MEKTSKNKWQVRLAALAIFVLGFIAGMLALNLYHARYPAPGERGGGPPFFGFRYITERLDLTSEQQAEVEKILGDARARLADARKQSEPVLSEIRRQTEERLQQTLTPQQWERFQQIKNEMKERRGGRGRGRRRN